MLILSISAPVSLLNTSPPYAPLGYMSPCVACRAGGFRWEGRRLAVTNGKSRWHSGELAGMHYEL